MSSPRSIKLILLTLVYFWALTLGAGLLVVSPVRVFLIVPTLAALGLLGHAVIKDHLDELGYAIMWLWATILALIVGELIVETFILKRDIPPLVELPIPRTLGTVGLVVVLVTTYTLCVQRSTQAEERDAVTT
ncbi:hypothetical protein LPA44_13705 [Halobacterium sp. KA-4]|uniref:hypothetical protein n=1 Tax=Halobacterium sp. KA-4 TaxID=2896367 RepID=UPI001E3D7330|nr:hypothetical protein [Halobacterium sp. KA-4]MCD2200940.1 hypothetical protein [Halobacterium sp. KA-4]